MALKGAALAKALASPDASIRCYLFYGADESGSRAQAARLVAGLGSDSERVDLTPLHLKADPALLSDEAASISLFGSRRYVRVDGAGDECFAAVDALMSTGVTANPVILIAGALRKDSRLVKLLDGHPAAVVVASFAPEGADAERMAITMARDAGLVLDDELARRLIESVAGDRGVLGSELEKLAIYAGAAPGAAVRLTIDMVEAVGAGLRETDLSAVVDALFAGDVRALDHALTVVGDDEAIPLVRAALRRALPMAAMRAEVDRGVDPRAAADKIGRSLFWKDRQAVARDVGAWSATRLSAAADRLASLEREVKSSGGAGALAVRQAFFAMARSVRRR